MHKMAQTAPKVIKVVNLKRFVPETTVTELIRTSYSPGFYSDPSNSKETIDNTFHLNDLTEIRGIDQIMVQKKSDVQNNFESYQMRISNRSKIKFRNCSHTTEELTTLHEHRDQTLVKVGDVFDTREAFKEYLNDNAKKWHYYYVCRNSKKKIVEYNCICMAYNLKQREVVIRRQKKRTTACPCKIRLTIDQTTHKMVVYYVCNHHDHPTTANAFYHYPHAKYLPQRVKEEFLDLTYLGVDVELIQKYIHSLVGLTIKKKDIWSYAYKFRKKIFHRSISDERQKYMDDLIIKIRDMYDESCDTTKMDNDKSSSLSGVVESTNDEETKLTTSTSYVNVTNNYINGTITEDLSIDCSQENPLKDVLRDISTDNTEVIVQYINGDSILCDVNGAPVTNSSAILQFINNYTYVTPEKDLVPTGFSELVNNDKTPEVYPIDWEALHNKSAIENCMIFESQPYLEDAEGPVLNDRPADASAGTKRLEHNEAVINECPEKSLPPTPPSVSVYVDMDLFRKYYFVDHRYIALDQDNTDQNAARNRKQTLNSPADPSLDEYIPAPDFVTNPSSIRHCRGHGHLQLLTEPDTVRAGAKFLTHDAFLAYTNERARRWHFYYSLVESGRYPEYYVYKCVYGRSRVSKNAYRARGLRKRNKLTTECPCQIRLRRVSWEPAYLTVLYSCNHHDHALDQGQFLAQQHSRRLPSRVREEVKDLITLRVGFDVLRKYVADETGVRVYGKYFHNVRAGMRARGERRQFTEHELAALKDKIRDLEDKYGNAAKEKPEANISQNQSKEQMLLFQVEMEDEVAMEDAETEYQDYLPKHTAKQSRLETRLQTLSHQEFMIKVQELQESVRSDVPRNNTDMLHTYVSH